MALVDQIAAVRADKAAAKLLLKRIQRRGKLKLVFPVVFRRQKDLTVGIRKIQVQNILLHVASSFSALMVSLARIRLSVTGVMPRKVATSFSCMTFWRFG